VDLREFQEQALKTDQVPAGDPNSLVVPLLGLVGEAGSLMSEYKKYLRDGPSHILFKERVSEELGDMLWYLANVASKFDLNLDEIAEDNLAKTRDRWGGGAEPVDGSPPSFDADCPERERFPRQFRVEITQFQDGEAIKVRAYVDGRHYGDVLTDNAYDPDGYRFHDVFHLAFAAVLGWSPVTRGLLRRKRKSNPQVDEVEDGGRAIVIEEGLVAMVFDYAMANGFLDGVRTVDYSLLSTARSICSHLEVGRCTPRDWELAILSGAQAWRDILRYNGGTADVDLDRRSISVSPRLGPEAV
jgi:NTP pyrophosphatase (non-canonical NTP hydrolase)